jgi:hypothetical protein
VSNSSRRRGAGSYLDENDLDALSLDLLDSLKFYENRKARIRDRLVKALGVTTASTVE